MHIREGARVEPDDAWVERIPLIGGVPPRRGTWWRRAEALLIIAALGVAYAVAPVGAGGGMDQLVEVAAGERAADLGPGYVMRPAEPERVRDGSVPARLVRAWTWVEGMATGLILPTDVTGRLAGQDPSLARVVKALWLDLERAAVHR